MVSLQRSGISNPVQWSLLFSLFMNMVFLTTWTPSSLWKLPAVQESTSGTVEYKVSTAVSNIDTTATTPRISNGNLPSFFEIASEAGTDKVKGEKLFEACRNNGQCEWPKSVNKRCKVGHNHFYHTMYERYLSPLLLSSSSSEPFTFLEVGFFQGKGYDSFTQYLLPAAPKGTEIHSLEINCGIYDQPKYQHLKDTFLHCGDASNYDVLQQVYQNHILRPSEMTGKPLPLKVVVDDASHFSHHIAISLFYWFPRIVPHGIMILEDIEPISFINDFRLHILPQLMKDLHYCGHEHYDPKNDTLCFPTIQPLLHAIHCEMHICVLIRNDEPATGHLLSKEQSSPPPLAFDSQKCLYGGY
jgi:hypothetical protein